MLTGDKEETAKNIGYATRMLNADQTALEFSSASLGPEALKSALAREADAVLHEDPGTAAPAVHVHAHRCHSHVLTVVPSLLFACSRCQAACTCDDY